MNPEPAGDPVQRPVQRPDAAAAEPGRGQQVDVDPPYAESSQFIAIDELEHLVVLRHRRSGERRQERQDLRAIREPTAREFTDHERMAPHDVFLKSGGQSRVAAAEVIDPDRGVDQYQGAGRRRATDSSPGWVPPSAARRRAFSRAINASRPACTTAVFPLRPLSRCASRTNSSSRFNVVLIHMNMHY